ncbi:MAG: hypothetical protein WC637_00090 [Victivallales bacterium]|jgi:hypothetical protein
MNLESEITEIKEKLDTVLHLLGHGREKSDAQIRRETVDIVEKIKLRDERRGRKNAT